MKKLTELKSALKAIAEGYPIRVEDDNFIVVENPEFEEGDGSNPNLVIDAANLDWLKE